VPLAALDEDGRRLTARDFTISEWDRMRGVRKGRRGFFCQWCQSPMHPRRNQLGTPYFQHNPGSSCPAAAGESEAHLTIKDNLVQSIRGVTGWRASVEERKILPDGGEYIADVVAHHEKAKKSDWVFEVQLSQQPEAETARRHQERIRGHGRCVWVTNRRTDWSTRYPSCQVGSDRTSVVDGLWRNLDEKMPPTPLPQVVDGFLADRLAWLDQWGFMPTGAWASAINDPVARRNRVLPLGTIAFADGDHVDDRCDVVPVDSHFFTPEILAAWNDDDWFLKASMAHGRRIARVPLNDVDVEAMRRWPHPIGPYEPLPSQSS
jgi:hypothetical protein